MKNNNNEENEDTNKETPDNIEESNGEGMNIGDMNIGDMDIEDMDIEEDDGFIPGLILGFAKQKDGTYVPASRKFNSLEKINLEPQALAAFLILVVENMVGSIPDSKQVEFEREGIKIFNEGVEGRDSFVDFKN
jgi:hypothetical protein